MSKIENTNNQPVDIYKVILDREGLNDFLQFVNSKNKSDVDYAINKEGEVYINLKTTDKIKVVPINFYDIITQKIQNLEDKENEAFLIEALDLIYEIID